MSQNIINRGTVAGDGTGDELFTIFGEVNDNFTELYISMLASGYLSSSIDGIPNGLSWLTDTISGFDIYAQGFARTPTMFFDPTASSSLDRGTLENPYSTQAALQLAITGNMTEHVIGFKRGTTLRATGTNGLDLLLHGSSASPVIFCPYGDAEALPIITGAAVFSDWTVEDAGENIWKRTIGATEHDAWQDDVRLFKKTWNTDAATTLTTEGTSTYNSNVLYIRPYNGESPNLGQMEVSVCDYALNLKYTDQADTGYIQLVGLDVRKARNNVVSITPDGVSTIVTAAGINLAGCRLSGAGVDNSTTLGRDGLKLYGPSTSVRLTDSWTRGCYAEGSLNNAFEYAFTDGHIHEFNRDDQHGGNHVEYWASNSNGVIRYNVGENHNTTDRIQTAVHKCGVWITNYTTYAADAAMSASVSNAVEFNYFHNMTGQGIEVFGGTGNKIRHNTLHQDADVSTNRLINFATNSPVTGACSCEISNNFVLGSNVGSRFDLDIIQGTADNDQSVSITATVTGDNNHYAQHVGNNVKLRVNKTNYVTPGTTYKAAVAPFDANATIDAGTTDGGTYIESDGSPSAIFPGIGAGKISLIGIGNRYLHGEAYDPAAPTIGAMV